MTIIDVFQYAIVLEISGKNRVIEVELSELRRDDAHWKDPQVVLLKEKVGDRILPIFIGFFEAQAIYLKINQIESPRPLTHDLLISIMSQLQATMEKVVINELSSDTYYANLYLINTQGEHTVIDARPSDAIALALRCQVPIYVEESVFNQIYPS